VIDYQGIATLMFAISTTTASTYALYRAIIGDRKMDRANEKIDGLAITTKDVVQNQVDVLAGQLRQHLALTEVVSKVEGVVGDVAAVKIDVADVKTISAKTEVNTNHMREALVEATKNAALLVGRDQGIAQEKERASDEATQNLKALELPKESL